MKTKTDAEYLAEFNLGDEPPHLRAVEARDAAIDEQVKRGRMNAERKAEEAAEERERRIDHGVQKKRERAEVERRFAAKSAETIDLPPRRTLTEFLAETAEPRQWRIGGLLPVGGNVLLNAKAKAGKSTLVANLIRSCIDGDNFLGRFPVRPTHGRVTLLDLELPEETLRDWLRVQGLRDTDAMEPIVMKGRAAGFDVRRDDVRAGWAERLAGTDFLIIDALAPLLGALKIAEATEAGDLLPFLDGLKAEAGISELAVIHHQGHGAERARGDSRLEGWPDAIWTYNKKTGDDDPGGVRYLRAHGRDVDLPETALDFDPATKRLSMGQGSRRDAAVQTALTEVLAALHTTGEAMSGKGLETALAEADLTRADVRAAIESGVRTGVLVRSAGPRGAHLYRPGTT